MCRLPDIQSLLTKDNVPQAKGIHGRLNVVHVLTGSSLLMGLIQAEFTRIHQKMIRHAWLQCLMDEHVYIHTPRIHKKHFTTNHSHEKKTNDFKST